VTNSILILIAPYLYATLLSLGISVGVIFGLKLVRKQAYKIRTMMLVAPLLGSVTMMVGVSSLCFIHWLSLNYPDLGHAVCDQIPQENVGFICTSLVTLAFVSFGSAVLLGVITYYLGDKIAIHLFGAKTLNQSEAKEIYQTLNCLSRKAGVKTPKLYLIERSTLMIFTVGRKNSHAIMVSVGLLENLSSKELEASLAHEISHIKNSDDLIRTMASIMKFATPFNLLGYLIEPAIYREREFLADEGSVTLTNEPSALISALIKFSEAWDVEAKESLLCRLSIGFFLESPSRGGIFSKHPPLEERLNRLLQLENASVGRTVNRKSNEKMSIEIK